ncbi:unnamed protein product, partial [Effrenium voratum]
MADDSLGSLINRYLKTEADDDAEEYAEAGEAYGEADANDEEMKEELEEGEDEEMAQEELQEEVEVETEEVKVEPPPERLGAMRPAEPPKAASVFRKDWAPPREEC